MNYEEFKKSLDTAEFELLIRRFAMSPAGQERGLNKQALLNFVIKQLDAIIKAGEQS